MQRDILPLKMKKAVFFSLVLLVVAVSTEVEGNKQKPSLLPKTGWRFGNGRCMCGANKTSPAPGGNLRTPPVHPTPGHHPSGPHGPPRHHPSRPHGHHPSRPHEHHHHGAHTHGPSHRGPHTRRPMDNNQRNRGMRKRHRGSHNRRPTRKQPKQVWKKCICGRPAEKSFKIKFRMLKKWIPEMANRKSGAYKRMSFKLIKKLAPVLKTEWRNIYNMRYTKGSIVAEFEVKKSDITKDPEKALRHAIHKGQLSDLEIEPKSLAVQQSYSGVKLSEWQTDEEECHWCGSVTQTRECIEVTASCDGIPLTRNASCYEACPRPRISDCRGFGKVHINMAWPCITNIREDWRNRIGNFLRAL